MGWVLPGIVSGGTITALVLSLPTVGPLLFRALLTEDMYLAGTIVMFLCLLTIIGMFGSDMVLVAIDPRTRFEEPRPDASTARRRRPQTAASTSGFLTFTPP